MLDLRLGGIEVDAVHVQFHRAHSRNALAEAQTEEIRQRIVLEKVRTGLITPDEAAQELGYETWADAELLNGRGPAQDQNANQTRTLRLKFDRASQKYRFQPDVLRLAAVEEETAPNSVVPFVKKKAQVI